MGRNPYRVASDADMDLGCSQGCRHLLGIAAGETQTDHVPRAQLARGHPETDLLGAVGDQIGESAKVALDFFDPPPQSLLQCRDGNRHQREVADLPHVEPSGTRCGLVGIADQGCEVAAVGADDPVVLERRSLAISGRHPHKAESVGAEQPLVGGGDEKVGLDLVHSHRQRPHRLATVHHQGGPHLAGALTDPDQIDQATVGPVTVGNRNDGRRLADSGEERSCPISLFGSRDGSQPTVGALGEVPPGIDVGRELLGQDHYLLAFLELEVLGGQGDAVGDGRHQRHPFGIAAHQTSKELSGFFYRLEEVLGRDTPGLGSMGERCAGGFDDRSRQGTEVGAVEIGDVVRNVEQAALTGEGHDVEKRRVRLKRAPQWRRIRDRCCRGSCRRY